MKSERTTCIFGVRLSGVGPRNYYETLTSNNIVEPPSDMFTLGAEYENDLPLVAVEISKYYTLDFTM